ncbi:MAG: hypothetical protein NTW50_01065 [Candidatus Berkelbacteria bacterium]|nr:hypothetical protein [Candidatus Berkelbacteria bacterium]
MLLETFEQYWWVSIMALAILFIANRALGFWLQNIQNKTKSKQLFETEGDFLADPYLNGKFHSVLIRNGILLLAYAMLTYFYWVLFYQNYDNYRLFDLFLGIVMLYEVSFMVKQIFLLSIYELNRRGLVGGTIKISGLAGHIFDAVYFLTFALLFLFVNILTKEWFFLGGFLTLVILAIIKIFQIGSCLNKKVRRS